MIYDITPHRISHIAFIFITLLLSAMSFQRTGVYKDDFSLWTDVVKKSSLKARSHNNLGRIYGEMKMWEQALKEVRTTVSLNPEYAFAYATLAHIYIENGMLDDAEWVLKRAIDLFAKQQFHFEKLHRWLGFVYIKKGLLENAVKEFNKAVALIPDHPDAKRTIAIHYTNEAWSYTDQGDFPHAILLHRIAVSIDPTYPDAHYGAAMSYEAAGQKEEAIKHWQDYLQLAPQDEPFRNDAMRHMERLKK